MGAWRDLDEMACSGGTRSSLKVVKMPRAEDAQPPNEGHQASRHRFVSLRQKQRVHSNRWLDADHCSFRLRMRNLHPMSHCRHSIHPSRFPLYTKQSETYVAGASFLRCFTLAVNMKPSSQVSTSLTREICRHMRKLRNG